MEIHVLHRQGKSIRTIAKELGVSRNTVKRYLRDLSKVPEYQNCEPRPTKLASFKPYLKERIDAAKPHWIPAVVLLEEIRLLGYDGALLNCAIIL